MSRARKALLVSDSIIVPDLEDARELFNEFYGKPLGREKPKPGEVNEPLILDPIEAVYLAEKGVISVVSYSGEPVSLEELRSWARRRVARFDLLYPAYKALRDLGLVVRPGLKFGGDFTVYRRGPGIDHSLFVVHALPWDEKRDPVELVKAGRLSHSVRKTFVLASIEPSGETSFLMFKWYRP